MRRARAHAFFFALAVTTLVLTARVALAQQHAAATSPWIEATRAQLGLDWNLTTSGGAGRGGALHIAYAFMPAYLAGIGAGVDWREGVTSFRERPALAFVHGEVFIRYLASEFAHVEAGLTGGWTGSASNVREDVSCGDAPFACNPFIGIYTIASLGYRYVFLSTRLRAGTTLGPHSRAGVIWSPLLLRAVVRF
jgi:hypothetical protein